MSATTSGWLSFTPRSSRRRATFAAMAIRSLSFSRGVSCIGRTSGLPGTRQASAAKRLEEADEGGPQRLRVGRQEARQHHAVPGADAARHARGLARRPGLLATRFGVGCDV